MAVMADERGRCVNRVGVCAYSSSTQELQTEGPEVLGHPPLSMEFGINQAASDPVFRRRQGVGCRMDVSYPCCSPGHFKKDLDPD